MKGQRSKKAIDLNNLSAIDGRDMRYDLSYLEFKELLTHFHRPATGFERIGLFFVNLFTGKNPFVSTVPDIENGTFHILDPETGVYKPDPNSTETGKEFISRQSFGRNTVSDVVSELEERLDSIKGYDDPERIQEIAEVSVNGIGPRILQYKLETDRDFAKQFKKVISNAQERHGLTFLTNFQNILHVLIDRKDDLDIAIQNKQVMPNGQEELLTHQIATVFGTQDRVDLMVRLHNECDVLLTEKDADGNNIFHVMASDMVINQGQDQSHDPQSGMKKLLDQFSELQTMSLEKNNKGESAIEVIQNKIDIAASISNQASKTSVQDKNQSQDIDMNKVIIKEMRDTKVSKGTTVSGKWDAASVSKESKAEREQQKKEMSSEIGKHRG